jgi:hypothetical protein
MTVIPPRPTSWKELNLLARCYLDFQHARISIERRTRLMLESVWIEAGLMEEVTVSTKKNSKGKTKNKYERRFIVYDDEEDNKALEAQAKKLESELPDNSEPYRIMLERAAALKADEKETLEACKRLMKGSALWDWIERVRGLSDVAAMTLLGYINPDRVRKVEQVWKYFGLYPNAKLISGQKANFNLELKGRMYLLARNIVMQKDPYYEQIYRMKKDYYNELDEIKEQWLTKPGGKMHIDMSAKITMIKLVVSHAVEIILKSNGKEFTSEHQNNRYLPPKPENDYDVQRYLKLYQDDMTEKIERRNKRYRESKDGGNGGDTNKQVSK